MTSGLSQEMVWRLRASGFVGPHVATAEEFRSSLLMCGWFSPRT